MTTDDVQALIREMRAYAKRTDDSTADGMLALGAAALERLQAEVAHWKDNAEQHRQNHSEAVRKEADAVWKLDDEKQRADAAEAEVKRLARVYRAAEDVCRAWPADIEFGRPGTSIGNLREALAATQPPAEQRAEDVGQKYERLAAQFHRETGMLAPGKDAPWQMPHTYEERDAAWRDWLAKQPEQRAVCNHCDASVSKGGAVHHVLGCPTTGPDAQPQQPAEQRAEADVLCQLWHCRLPHGQTIADLVMEAQSPDCGRVARLVLRAIQPQQPAQEGGV